MVARIKIGKSIKGSLLYNEQKISAGSAELILGSGFATEIERLDIQQKINRFRHLTDLRPTVKTNCLHISLNFDASEKLDNAKMQAIAMSYMDRIGFADQPYLVYRHHDAGHQHMHIVSTSIQNDATCISLHNIARDRSEPARKAIELEFGLLVAENKKKNPSAGIRPIDLEKVSYGKLSTKRAISSVLEGVLYSYRFTSLAEFNALLRCFNVVADRGQEDSEMFKKEGLVYAVLDGLGNKIGVPLKASSFYAKPTLKTLEKIFERNSLKPKPDARITARKIDRVIFSFEKLTRSTLLSELRKNGVELVIRENESGLIYGTTYVDHGLRAVIKGSRLGKAYGAKAIGQMLGPSDVRRTYLKPSAPGMGVVGKTSMLFGNAGKGLVDVLLADTFEATEPELLRKRKTAKKRRR